MGIPICPHQLNSSGPDYQTAACILTVYCLSTLCVIGLLLNLTTICIFVIALAKGHRSPMTFYLLALSAFDSLQLLLSIFVIVLGAVHEYLVDEPLALQLIVAYSFRFLYPVLMIVNYASVWTITLICVQRYFAVCYPLSTLRTVEIKYSALQVFVVIFFAVAVNLCRFWEFQLKFENGTTTLDFGLLHPRFNPDYLLIMGGVVYFIFLYFFPFVLVVFMNIRIILTICRARKLIPSFNMSSRSRKEYRSTLMVLTIILLFFTCYTLAVAHRWWSLADETAASTDFGGLLSQLSNFLVNLNSAVNPLIYFLFSRGFKDWFSKMRTKKHATDYSAVGAQSSPGLARISKNRRFFNNSMELGSPVSSAPSSYDKLDRTDEFKKVRKGRFRRRSVSQPNGFGNDPSIKSKRRALENGYDKANRKKIANVTITMESCSTYMPNSHKISDNLDSRLLKPCLQNSHV